MSLSGLLNCQVTRKNIGICINGLNDNIQGSSWGGKIELNTNAGTKTLIHEIAHELMHRGDDRQNFTRKEKELEAEAVAYVVGSHFGLSDLASPNYLALWDADESKILDRIDRIRTTATDIIKSIEPQSEVSED
jgi:hypothetical protein